ncbi:MAG TPA: alpha/beta hydrolase [Phycisphaerae bacterium]|nr:alpha/beta hydrolase [Phycisphaerae bacterium]HRW53519.1 alpha/beta hydrolase [Phycisphaerae bacterium]
MNTLSVRGIEMAYSDVGAGPVVLCVHGFPLSHRLWASTAERLSNRFRLIAPDLRGFGASTATATASMADYADDLAALLDALGVSEPVVVMGLSMGGYVTFEFVRRHARRVRALVLADTQSGADTPEKAASRMEGAARVLAEGNQWVVDGMAPILFAEDAPKTLVQEWREIMLATNPQGTSAGMRAMADRIDSATTFAQIQCPTLVVVGELDAIAPPKVARIMAEGIEGARLEILPGVGHMAPVEAPYEYARIVGDFLSENL